MNNTIISPPASINDGMQTAPQTMGGQSVLMHASHQWATRPADECYTNLLDMQEVMHGQRRKSRQTVVSNRAFSLAPVEAMADGSAGQESSKALSIVSRDGQHFAPNHWATGQLAQLAGAPAGYLRSLPSHLAADCMNYGLKHARDVEDVGLLLYRNGSSVLKAATGPKYGRIWNADIVDSLVHKFGDGVNGQWSVPGEFGPRGAREVTKENTTLYAGDRDMFVFLADEETRISIPNRRGGKTGELARGFFLWNSEVGSKSFGLGTFLFDYMCGNHIIWGAENFQQITIRHTAGAPDRWLEEITPALQSYAASSGEGVRQLVQQAQAKRVDDVDAFLKTRFGARQADQLKAVHMLEEERPIESLWDVTTAATALAKGIKFADDRVALEKIGGDILKLAAV